MLFWVKEFADDDGAIKVLDKISVHQKTLAPFYLQVL